jgi:hypothetical protein
MLLIKLDSKEWSSEHPKEIVGPISKISFRKIMLSLMEKPNKSKKKKCVTLSFSQVLVWKILKTKLEESLILSQLIP